MSCCVHTSFCRVCSGVLKGVVLWRLNYLLVTESELYLLLSCAERHFFSWSPTSFICEGFIIFSSCSSCHLLLTSVVLVFSHNIDSVTDHLTYRFFLLLSNMFVNFLHQHFQLHILSSFAQLGFFLYHQPAWGLRVENSNSLKPGTMHLPLL